MSQDLTGWIVVLAALVQGAGAREIFLDLPEPHRRPAQLVRIERPEDAVGRARGRVLRDAGAGAGVARVLLLAGNSQEARIRSNAGSKGVGH